MARQKRSFFSTFAGMILFLLCAAVFLLGCVIKNRSLKNDAAELDQQIAVLEEQLEEEKMKAIESQVQQRYLESDAYKEILARTRFNLIHEGDRLYIIK